MNGKKINHYNVYKGLDLIAKCVTNREAAAFSGCDPGQISTYAADGRPYRGKLGTFKFQVIHTEITAPKKPIIKTTKNTDTEMSQEWIDGWNEMLTASQLLRSGCGHMIKKNGQRFVIKTA